MTGDQYRKSLERLGLNISTGAEFLGIDVTTSRRYANNRMPVPRIVEKFLAFAIETMPDTIHEEHNA